MTIIGSEFVGEAFRVLGDKAARRVLKSAAQAGASTWRRALIQSAPVSMVQRKKVYQGHKYEYLKKHLREQIKATVVKSIECDVKVLIHTGDAFWGYFVEKGTKRGIEAQHWMEKATEGVEDRVLTAVEEKLVQAIIREAGK